MTSVHEDDTVLAEFKGQGLSKDQLYKAIEMIEKEEILRQFDFENLKPDSRGQYRIWVPDETRKGGKTRVYARNIDNLKERVYSHIKGQPYTEIFRTFSYVFAETMKFELQNTSSERQVSRNNTIHKNWAEYNRFFRDTFIEDKPIESITVRDLDEIIRYNFRRYQLHKGGRNSMRTLLNLTFKRAMNMEWITENPASRIIWKDYDRLIHQSAPISQRAYTDDQLKKLLDANRERHEKDPAFITAYAHEFQNLTAFRRGEVCPLLWEDVNLEEGYIYVHQEQLVDRSNNNAHVIVDHTKTFKDRYYPIDEPEIALLNNLKEVHDRYYPDSPFLFPADTSTGCITCKAVEDYHRRLCKKLDIPISSDCRKGPHAFRRNRITEIVNATNGNIDLVATMYGNSPDAIRKNYYTTNDLELMREALKSRRIV